MSTELGFAALLLGMLLAQLDTNIVVAALPTITGDLGAGTAIAGVTAAYLLTVTITTPAAGKLGDVLGRRAVFATSIVTFAIGSIGCAVADSMATLILARAIQGIGGAGLIVTAVSTLGQMFDRTELIRRQIWLTVVTAVAALAGPPAGGYLSSAFGWHSIFLLNLPVCVLALIIGLRGLPSKSDRSALRNFDVYGVLLVALLAGSIVLLGSFPDLAHSRLWAPVLVALAGIGTAGFVRRERRAIDPLIPPSLFASPGLAKSIIVTFLSGSALFGTFTFIPLALTEDTGWTVGAVSGLLIALTGGQLLITATFAGVARRYPRMVPWGRLALAMGVVGLGLLAAVPQLGSASSGVTLAVALVGLALSGAALGLSMQAYTLLGIAAAPPNHFGAAMATLTSARQLGGSLGVALFGWAAIVLPSTDVSTVILGTAAALLVIALTLAPRTTDEPPTEPAQ